MSASHTRDPITVFDPALATTTERAVLMLIERVDELERRLQQAERNTFAHLLTVTGAGYIIVYVETLCFVLGLEPIEFHRRKTSSLSLYAASPNCSVWGTLTKVIAWALSTNHDPASLSRAEGLHRVMFKGAQHPPAPFWSPKFAPPVTVEDDNDMMMRTNVVAMLRHLSVTESEEMWEWRLVRAGWSD